MMTANLKCKQNAKEVSKLEQTRNVPIAPRNVARKQEGIAMTREEYAALTDEEKRIKVASIHRPHEKWERYYGEPIGCRWRRNGVIATAHPLNYLNDLNAMHEAEKLLIGIPATSYEKLLAEITADPWHATAAQRAEAFVLTMDKG